MPGEQHFAFDDVCVVTSRAGGTPPHRTNVARGTRQLVVIPDAGAAPDGENWERLGRRVRPVSLDLPHPYQSDRFRLIATIVLAEIARQVG